MEPTVRGKKTKIDVIRISNRAIFFHIIMKSFPVMQVMDYSSSSEDSESSDEDGETVGHDGTVAVSDIPRIM